MASVILVDRLRHPAIKLGDQNDVSFSTNPALGSPTFANALQPCTGPTSGLNPPLRSNCQLPGYMVTNLRGGYRIWKKEKRSLDLSADIQNLFNVKYREAYSQQEWWAPGIGAAMGGELTF
jgi:outer membrane receptor protein involved in Fe transport